jgi:hypothetical protein
MLQDVPLVAAGATVNVYLPAKGATDNGGRMTIEGEATELLEGDSDSS